MTTSQWIEQARRLFQVLPDADSDAQVIALLSQTPSDWISVKDRLPEKYAVVVVCVNDRCPIRLMYLRENGPLGDGAFLEWATEHGDGMDMEWITHWQSLPKPPEPA